MWITLRSDGRQSPMGSRFRHVGHVDNSASAEDEKVAISTEKVMLNGLAEVGYNAPP